MQVKLDRVFTPNEVLHLKNGTIVEVTAFTHNKIKVDLHEMSYEDARMYHQRMARKGKRS